MTNFTASFGSLVYLNWYAGEAATAVLVANVPHLWPLIATVFHLGAFKPGSGNSSSGNKGLSSHQYPSRGGTHQRSIVGIPSARSKNKYDIDVYEPSSSEEHIASNGDKDMQWGYSKKSVEMVDSIAPTSDLEMGKPHMTTSIQGGSSGTSSKDAAGIAVEEVELGAWPMKEDRKSDSHIAGSPNGQILKTVHMDQFASGK